MSTSMEVDTPEEKETVKKIPKKLLERLWIQKCRGRGLKKIQECSIVTLDNNYCHSNGQGKFVEYVTGSCIKCGKTYVFIKYNMETFLIKHVQSFLCNVFFIFYFFFCKYLQYFCICV